MGDSADLRLRPASVPHGLPKPSLRGVMHQAAFFLSLPLGVALVLEAEPGRGQLAAGAFAVSVAAMFGASALYHRPDWSPARRRWLRRLDHAGVYGLIAGTYTPVGLLVLTGAWRIAVLAIVWTGAGAAIVMRLAWVTAPKWLAVLAGVTLGWVGVVVFPQLVTRVGIGPSLILLAGGVLYTAGALVYARRRPDPAPSVFGYHEVFHALVTVAVTLQYVAIAFFVLPRA